MFIHLFKPLFDGLARPEDVHLHLLLGDAQHLGYLLVRLSLHVAQLHAGALLLGQLGYQSPHHRHAVALHRLLLGVRGIRAVGLVVSLFKCGVHVVGTLHLVEGLIAADGQAESLYRLQLVPLLAAFPDSQHRLLHNVLRISSVESDAQCQPEELSFSGSTSVRKLMSFILSNSKTNDGQKSYNHRKKK